MTDKPTPTDAMVLAALQIQYPAAYGKLLRHPANGPKTAERTEAEIDTARRMIAAALAAAPTSAAQADSVWRDADRIEKWSDRVQRAHPKSEPEFWPDALRVKYMADEIRDLRAARAPAQGVQEDAACWHWLAEYLVGTRTDLDDEIVASETVNDLRKIVEAAIKQGEKQ